MTDAPRLPATAATRRGIVAGLGSGVVAGVVWYLVVLGTTSMQTYLIPALGVGVSFGVYRAMHQPGRRAAVISTTATALTVVVSLYYVERHLVVQWFSDNHDSIAVPLVPYLNWVVEVLGHAYAKGPAPLLYSIVALVAAWWFGMHGFEHQHHDAGRG